MLMNGVARAPGTRSKGKAESSWVRLFWIGLLELRFVEGVLSADRESGACASISAVLTSRPLLAALHGF